MNLRAVVPLDADGLLRQAERETGLDNFGEDDGWRDALETLTRALDQEAELNLMGRLMTRSDLLVFLESRLWLHHWLQRHPEIAEQEIRQPLFILGLPRSGTSILYELLACDPEARVPETWEILFPSPPPERGSYASDARVQRAHALVTQWGRVAPTYDTMHEMGGRIPSECGMLMAGSFITDHFQALQQTPSYDALLASVDWAPAYRHHRRMLQLLQWRCPGRYWLLKAPNHMNQLPTLLREYPDARIVQTHRDPIKCMASAANLLGTLFWMRSDKGFDATAFEDVVMGEATAARLERVMQWRDDGVVPAGQIADSRYQDLMEDPLAAVRHIYAQLGRSLESSVAECMAAYLAEKPRGKFGAHQYETGADAQVSEERRLFARYQARYQVPDEA